MLEPDCAPTQGPTGQSSGPDPNIEPGRHALTVRFIEHLEAGCSLDMRIDGTNLAFPADLIRIALVGRLVHPITGKPVIIDPYGIRITNSTIADPLDLEGISATTALSITHSSIHSIDLDGARLQNLNLTRTIFQNGPLRLIGAKIAGQLVVNGAHLAADGDGDSLLGGQLVIGGGMFGGHSGEHRFSTEGALRLPGATINGQLNLSGAHIGADKKQCSLFCDNLTVNGGLYCRPERGQRFIADGAIRIPGAHITGKLVLVSAHVGADMDKISVIGDNLRVDGGINCSRTPEDSAHSVRQYPFYTAGSISIDGALITGRLDLAGSRLGSNLKMDSLVASNLKVVGSMLCDSDGERFIATGGLSLRGAHVTGQLVMNGAHLGVNLKNNSLYCDNVRVDGNVFCNPDDAERHALETAGAIRLKGASISGQLNLIGARLGANSKQRSLVADNLKVGGNVLLRSGTFHRFRTSGTLSLYGATVGGSVGLPGAPGIVDGKIALVDLRHSQIGRIKVSDPARSRILLDDCTYQSRPNTTPDELDQWLKLLQNPTGTEHKWGEYEPRAYQQLAKANRDAGHDRDATRILMAQQDHRRHTALTPAKGEPKRTKARLWIVRAGLGVTKFVTGYGHRPAKVVKSIAILAFITTVLILSAANVSHVDADGATLPYARAATTATPLNTPAPPSPNPPSARACSGAEQLGLGLRLAVPLITNISQGSCTIVSNKPLSLAFGIASWLTQLFAWVLALLYGTAAANLIRR